MIDDTVKNNPYYVLEFFLDPGETNPNKLRDIIKQKISEWNKKANLGGQYKSKVELAKKWLEDIGSQNLKQLSEAAKEDRLLDLDEDIIKLEKDDLLERSEYEHLVKTYSCFFTEATIRSRIHLEISEDVSGEHGFAVPEKPQLPPGIKPIPDREMLAIDLDLKIFNADPALGKGRDINNLYELIGCSKNSNVSILSAKVKDLLQKNLKKPTKTSGVEAESRLLGKANLYFRTEDSKRSYDYSLDRKPILEFKNKRGAWALRAVKKRVTIQEYLDSIQEAVGEGIGRKEAEWLVYEFFCIKCKCPSPFETVSTKDREKAEPLILKAKELILSANYSEAEKILLEIETLIPGSQQVNVLRSDIARRLIQQASILVNDQQYDKANVLITKAKTISQEKLGAESLLQQIAAKQSELQKKIQNIQTLETDIRVHIQNRHLYQAEFLLNELRVLSPSSPIFTKEGLYIEKKINIINEKLRKITQVKDYSSRISLCEEILLVATDCQEANTILLQCKNQIKEEQKKAQHIQSLLSEIKESIQLRRFYKANELLTELCSLCSDISLYDKEKQQVDRTIAEVNRKLQSVERIMDDTLRLSVCEEILSIASDCQEAKSVINRIPPIPPDALNVTIGPHGIDLKWKKSASKSFTGYCVVRKAGGTPSSIEDGKIVNALTSDTHFCDTTAEIGVAYGYGVWTVRDKLVSTIGCFAGLVQITGDVMSVNVQTDNQTLNLSWSLPGRLLGLLISRWVDGESKQKTKIRLLGNKKSYSDTGLNNGILYNYLIQCIYKGLDGNEVLSKGVMVTGIPSPAPKSVNDLRVGVKKDLIVFNWTPPQYGDFYIFCLPNKQSFEPGYIETRSLADLISSHGPPLTMSVVKPGIATTSILKNGILHFLPATLINGKVAYGRIASLSIVPNVTKVRLRITSEILLKWNWPENIYEVKILWRRDTTPVGPNDPKAESKRFRRSHTSVNVSTRTSNAVGNAAFNRSYKNGHFLICSYIPESKKYSTGIPIFAERTSLRYDFHIDGNYGIFDIRRCSVNGMIPEMMVRLSSEHIPFNRNDGEWIMSTPASNETKTTIKIPLDEMELDEDQYVALFINDEEKETAYSIDAPPMSELNLRSKAEESKNKRSWFRFGKNR